MLHAVDVFVMAVEGRRVARELISCVVREGPGIGMKLRCVPQVRERLRREPHVAYARRLSKLRESVLELGKETIGSLSLLPARVA